MLRIAYTGEVSRTLTDGAFQQKQGDDWYIFTKFEPVTARRVFPCFDKPSYKVPWQLTRASSPMGAFCSSRRNRTPNSIDIAAPPPWEHEMSHQWFGDLVTTAWWDDMWLNEAFASWLSSKLLNEWKPEWQIEADAHAR